MLRRYRLALGLWICGIVMLFVALVSASIVRRGIPAYESGTQAYSTQWESLPLSIPLLILNFCVLIAGCVALELARRRSRAAVPPANEPSQGFFSWMCAAIVLSLAFLVGQGMAWSALRAHGLFMSSNARVAFFYLLTSVHALQIAAGLLVLIWIATRHAKWTAMGSYIAIDLSAWYFYAMTAVWLALFCFLVFA